MFLKSKFLLRKPNVFCAFFVIVSMEIILIVLYVYADVFCCADFLQVVSV